MKKIIFSHPRLKKKNINRLETDIQKAYLLFWAGKKKKVKSLLKKMPLEVKKNIIYQLNTDIGMSYLNGKCNVAQKHWFDLSWLEKKTSYGKKKEFLGKFWTSALGHLCLLFFYLKRESEKKKIIYLPNSDGSNIANKYFYTKIINHFKDKERKIIFFEEEKKVFEQLGPNLETKEFKQQFFCNVFADQEKTLNEKKRNTFLQPAENEKINNLIKKYNPENRPIVCFHLREGGFYNEEIQLRAGRNADIQSCGKALEWLIDQGVWIVRLGDPSMQRLPTQAYVFDYAHSQEKCPELDIEIPARSKMMVTNNSGYALFPILFDIPAAYVQFMPLACRPWNRKGYLLPKKYFSNRWNRLLTFQELFGSPLGHVESTEFLKRKQIKLIDNSSEEIKDCVKEVWDEFVCKKENYDDYRNEKVQEFAEQKGSYRGTQISIKFLKNNKFLLKETELGRKIKALLAEPHFLKISPNPFYRLKYYRKRLKTRANIDVKKLFLIAEKEIQRGKLKSGKYLLRKTILFKKNWTRALNLWAQTFPLRYPEILMATNSELIKAYGYNTFKKVRLALEIFKNPSLAAKASLKELVCIIDGLISEYAKERGPLVALEKTTAIYFRGVSDLAVQKFNEINSQIGIQYLSGGCEEALSRWRLLNARWRQFQQDYFPANTKRYLMHGWTPAIGHIALIDFYQKLRTLGLIESFDVSIMPWPNENIANPALLNYWSSFFPIISQKSEISKAWPQARFLEIPMNHFFFLDGWSGFYSHAAARAQIAWEKAGRGPLLSLKASDISYGWDRLKKIGLGEKDWYVTLHIREPGFHKQWMDPLRVGRDVDISTYAEGIRRITRAGGWVIRMGDPTMKRLPKMDRVWDYAHSPERSDRMDVFLLGSCRFFVGTNSGVSYVPPIFGRPCLYTNWCALDHRPWWSANLLIHKNIRQRKSGDLVPYSRLIPPPLGHVESVDFLHGQGLELVDNSPEELADAIEEMIQLVEGRRKTGKKHQQDVETYRQISAASGGYRGPGICETFLSRYPQLLN